MKEWSVMSTALRCTAAGTGHGAGKSGESQNDENQES